MLVLSPKELAVAQPFEVQCENASLGEVDAAFLLVLDRFSRRADMSVYIQDGRHSGLQHFRFVEECRRLETRYDLVTELPDPIPLAGLYRPDLVESGR